MAQDEDIARVAAALRSPALRYRNFGNEPVRQHGAVPPPVAGVAERTAWTPPSAPPLRAEPLPPAVVEPPLAPQSMSRPAPAPMPILTVPPKPVPAPPAPVMAQAPVPPAPGATAPAPAPVWPLFDALAASAAHPPPIAPHDAAAGGTLGALLSRASPPAAAPAWPFAAPGPQRAAATPVPAAAPPAPPAAGLLPAAQVTTPLAEVLATLGRNLSSAASPFAGLRAGGPGPGGR